MTIDHSTLEANVRAWMAADPEEDRRAELASLLESGKWEELQDRFSGFLKFGTAGLRGVVGAGPMRMNRAVVLRATVGFCRYLLANVPDAASRGLVVGCDARLQSEEFAEDVRRVALHLGMKVFSFRESVPTPMVAFATLREGAAGGVCVTASHNPPEYNGYKVFWGNGAQIIPPHDKGIAAEIAKVDSVAPFLSVPAGQASFYGSEIFDEYDVGVEEMLPARLSQEELRVAYSPMHGVGGKHIERLNDKLHLSDLWVVDAQAKPDGRFPTVNFPNPEDQNAMAMVVEHAKANSCDLALANDPDADRLAAAVRHHDEYVFLNGNEIGCLLAHYLLERRESNDNALVVSTIVSSPMLVDIATKHGARCEQTLTGHKWIHNRAIELESKGYEFVFGYEEAIGFAPGVLVRDKDGLSSFALIVEAARHYKKEGRTLVDELGRMYQRYGMYLSDQISVVLPGAEGREQIDAAMQRGRGFSFDALDGYTFARIDDYVTRERRFQDGKIEAIEAVSDNVVGFFLEGGHRVMMRPSGTEPKLKMYFDFRVDLNGELLDSAETQGKIALDSLIAAFRKTLAL